MKQQEKEDKSWEPIVPTQSMPDGCLTKREYFAGLALQGILSNPNQKALSVGYGCTRTSLYRH